MPSIYRPKDTNASDADVRHGAYVNTEGQPAQGAIPDEQSVWAGRRRAQPANVLLPATQRWLDSLPADNRPSALAAQFPRVANLIAVNWNNPGDCCAFIYSLLNDQRGGRRGFPRDVSQDIVNLRVHYLKLHPIVDWQADDGHWKPSTPKW